MLPALPLPFRAALIASIAALSLSLLCSCAQALAPVGTVDGPAATASENTPRTGIPIATAQRIDRLFEHATTDRCTRTVRPSFRDAFAPSL